MLLRWILGDPDCPREEKQVAAHYKAAFWRYFGNLHQQYQRRNGRVLITDSAKELCASYSENKETRAKYSACLYRPAKEFIRNLYDREIGLVDVKTAVFLSGGAGSGKSSLQTFVKRWK